MQKYINNLVSNLIRELCENRSISTIQFYHEIITIAIKITQISQRFWLISRFDHWYLFLAIFQVSIRYEAVWGLLSLAMEKLPKRHDDHECVGFFLTNGRTDLDRIHPSIWLSNDCAKLYSGGLIINSSLIWEERNSQIKTSMKTIFCYEKDLRACKKLERNISIWFTK